MAALGAVRKHVFFWRAAYRNDPSRPTALLAGFMKGKPVSFSAFGYDNCWPKAVSYVDHILSRSISTFFAVMFVYELETEEISQTLVGTDPVSPRGSQLKNLLLHGCSSSFCPRCIIRRKMI